ncbi:hypothetical protein C8R46DRAFT_1024391 [Mycena filopes]|nr:hypothetical protein C8R46DRAFT_1024391 [Mycena filopes]
MVNNSKHGPAPSRTRCAPALLSLHALISSGHAESTRAGATGPELVWFSQGLNGWKQKKDAAERAPSLESNGEVRTGATGGLEYDQNSSFEQPHQLAPRAHIIPMK